MIFPFKRAPDKAQFYFKYKDIFGMTNFYRNLFIIILNLKSPAHSLTHSQIAQKPYNAKVRIRSCSLNYLFNPQTRYNPCALRSLPDNTLGLPGLASHTKVSSSIMLR